MRALDPKFRWLMAATDPSDIMRLAGLAAEGRLVSIDGGREDVLPGVDLRAGHDTHTWGSQFVTIRNAAARARMCGSWRAISSTATTTCRP